MFAFTTHLAAVNPRMRSNRLYCLPAAAAAAAAHAEPISRQTEGGRADLWTCTLDGHHGWCILSQSSLNKRELLHSKYCGCVVAPGDFGQAVLSVAYKRRTCCVFARANGFIITPLFPKVIIETLGP